YYLFYIGYKTIDYAQTGVAKSKDGISGWERHPANPIVSPGEDYDLKSVYITQVIYREKEKRWYLWYSGRNRTELPCLATFEGDDLRFSSANKATVLCPNDCKPYIDAFNADDDELYKQSFPNEKAWEFLSQNIPLFDYPDKTVERTYYFRWWTFRKHIRQTPEGYVISEFLPDVGWAGQYNAISFPAICHFSEGRWLNDRVFLDRYTDFWLGGTALPAESEHPYLFPVAVALQDYFYVTGDGELCKKYLPQLIKNFRAWESRQRDPNRMFWQMDGYDGGELSATTNFWRTKTKDAAFYGSSSKHYRINSNAAAAAEAFAIAEIAERAGDSATAEQFRKEAEELRELLHTALWDKKAAFYKHAFRGDKPADGKLQLSPFREQYGYYPWYFPALNVPGQYNAAWKQLTDAQGFYAPYGPTTCEQRSPYFQIAYTGHECLWDGPSWPFNTSITLTALANEINRNSSAELKEAWIKTFDCYVRSHFLQREDGKYVSWIDENLNPYTGDWIARTRLKTWKNGTWDASKGGVERGKDYNHSTFCDLVITGLTGLRPSAGNGLTVFPLVPNYIPYFCLDNISYHGHTITVFWDKDGNRYSRGAGFHVLIDGQEKLKLDNLPEKPVVVEL
ncbi:MAG: hypothetical protein LBC19_13990, partial [Tannerella sp.]|nr:hypothetical protein [Tannerella sp.]